MGDRRTLRVYWIENEQYYETWKRSQEQAEETVE